MKKKNQMNTKKDMEKERHELKKKEDDVPQYKIEDHA